MIGPRYGTICIPRRPPCTWGAGPGSLLPTLIGVDTVRVDGSPTVVNSGTSRSSPTISISSPNEVSVVQRRRSRSAHEVSSKLSANMASSSINPVYRYGHHKSPHWRSLRKKKRPRNHAALLELSGHARCPIANYLGGSAGFGVVGLGVVVPGAFTAGLVPLAGVAG